ncbi:MAG: phosphoadenosine phosphosulfate reductase family protein [Thermodesulfobacteriota bacterium]|nr:phosphoadenosine phosphosulfate reductase family protein [Thermodesulfobacteriota bacterium]
MGERSPGEKREENAISVIQEALSKAKHPFIVFTGDIHSLVILHMVRRIAGNSIPVLHIDTTLHFQEIYLYIEKMRRFWGFQLIKERNKDVLGYTAIEKKRGRCCRMLKTEPLRKAIEKYTIDFLFTGMARDGNGSQKGPILISSTKGCLCLNPVAYLTRNDVWNYIKEHSLPYCSLYDRGYEDIDCMPCTEPPEDVSEMKQGEQEIHESLKALGYM